MQTSLLLGIAPTLILYFQGALLDVEHILVVLCNYTFVFCHNAWAKKRWQLIYILYKCKPPCFWGYHLRLLITLKLLVRPQVLSTLLKHTAYDCWTLVDFDRDGDLDLVKVGPANPSAATPTAVGFGREVRYYENATWNRCWKMHFAGFAVPGNQFWEPGPGSDGFHRFCGSKVPGSEGCVPEVSKVSVFNGSRQVRFCSRGLQGASSGNRVLGTQGSKKVPGSGDSIPKVPKVTLYLESILLYYENILLICKLNVWFCTLKVHFCTLPQCLLQVALKINTARAKKRS